jgi:hypothetical protein
VPIFSTLSILFSPEDGVSMFLQTSVNFYQIIPCHVTEDSIPQIQ